MTDSYDTTEVNELVLYDGGDADAHMKWYVHPEFKICIVSFLLMLQV